MKKIFIIIIIIILIGTIISKSENIIIPDNAIRFRVIANSNNKEDQQLKKDISNNIQKDLYPKLLNAKTKDEAKSIITNNINNIDNSIKETINKNNRSTPYNINYGTNHFPEKKYKGIEYPEGNYESLVITLGEGTGNNWWCVLFPPLCLLEGEEKQAEEVEYKSYIKELIDKYL